MELDGRCSAPSTPPQLTPPPSPPDFRDFNTTENVFVPCNGARRMSEGGLVMPACSANNFNNNNRMAATLPKRKYSFPATLHSPSLQAELANCNGVNVGPSLTVATARRRFSNVSDVVSRKLSHTIGWRTAVPTEQIARQGKYMCVQYVRWKLKRAGVYTKKCAGALRCARAAVGIAAATEENATAADPHGSGYFIPPQVGSETSVPVDDTQNDSVPREVFPAVLRVGLHLERLDPKLYAADTRVCSVTSSEKIASPSPSAATTLLQQRLEHRNPTFGWDDDVTETTTAAVLLVSVSRELFRAGAQVTWAKIVSLLCFASRLAVDCARRGNAEQLPDLIEAVGEVIEDDLAAWIHYNGGWVGLQMTYFKPVIVNVENPVFTQIVYLISLLVIVIFFLLLLKWLNFISMFR